MKNYVKYTSEMDKTAAYPAYLEISNSLRQIMKYQLDMEYYTDVMEDRAAKAQLVLGMCKEIEDSLARCINQLQHLDTQTRDYISAMERYFYGENSLENSV